MTNWIKVSERLPANEQSVLVYIPNYPGITIGNFNEGYFYDDVLRFDHDNNPTYWMPLPELPE